MTNNYYDVSWEGAEAPGGASARLLNLTWTQYSSEWNSAKHSHRHAELFFILGGEGSIGLRHSAFPVRARELVVVNPGVLHCEISQAVSPLELVVLGVDGLNMETDDLGCVHTRFDEGWDSVVACLRLMLREVRGAREGYQLVCQHLLEVLLLYLVRRGGLSLAGSGISRADSRECELVRRYIDEHFKENITLDQLAELAHINKYYLVHAFRKAYDTSPISYQISRRIQESRFLLESSDHSLSQIARILGFSSPSYFSQSFRRSEGMSPLEYRKRCRRDGPGERS